MGKYKFGPILDKKLEGTNALLSFKQFPIMDKEMLLSMCDEILMLNAFFP
jgi:hypothetical protein